MKILFVIDTYYTSNNGTSISAQRYAAELRRRGHEVRLLCGDRPTSADDERITDGDYCTGMLRIPIFQPLCEKHDFYYAKADRKVIAEACEWADVVHIYTPFFLSNATIACCKQTGKPVTAAFHVQPENITSSLGMGKVRWLNTMIYRIFRWGTYNRVRHVHTPSAFIAGELIKNGYRSKMHVISNGIHDAFIEAGQRKLAQDNVEQQPTLTPKSEQLIKIMMIGRLSREKRQDVIINAMRYSRYANRIQLVFAGRGPEYQRYVRMGRMLKHRPQFIFKQREELIRELLTTDLYIHASDMEIEAISCIEAFATGLVPVIADSRDSATPQFALDERSLFRAGDPKDLARAIDYWLDHTDERLRMQREYARAAKQYTISRSVQLFEKMLRQAIADNRRGDIDSRYAEHINARPSRPAADVASRRANNRIA